VNTPEGPDREGIAGRAFPRTQAVNDYLNELGMLFGTVIKEAAEKLANDPNGDHPSRAEAIGRALDGLAILRVGLVRARDRSGLHLTGEDDELGESPVEVVLRMMQMLSRADQRRVVRLVECFAEPCSDRQCEERGEGGQPETLRVVGREGESGLSEQVVGGVP
jgi:hypothetical protein